MTPLYKDPWFTFRFADDRIVPRFHLEGVAANRPVTVYRLDEATETRRQVAQAVCSADGWVHLPVPLIVRAGDVFIAVPES